MGFKNISYLSFFKYSNFDLIHPPFITDFEDDFKNNTQKYSNVYDLLSDEKSKNIFTKIINFKITFDYIFMDGFTNNHAEQYFDKELLPKIKNMTFVDGGGYVGDTVQELIKNYPDVKRIYFIEPILNNIKIAKRKLHGIDNITFLTLGISNKKATLNFNDEKSFSAIYGTGTQSVEVDMLDNLIKEKVDFIKLDIEGAEQDAIFGAKNTIKKYKPILAICIYHKAQDWYKIPNLVLNIEPNYKIYIRHYMEGIFETVMYFIPR